MSVRATGKRELSLLEQILLKIFPEGWASVTRVIALLVVIFLAAVSLFPLYWGVITSFKLPQDIGTVPPSFTIKHPTIENYTNIIRGLGVPGAPVGKWFVNSIIVTLACTSTNLLVTSLAGYAFARKQFWFRDQLFWILVFCMLLPQWSTMTALWVWTKNLELHDSFWALIFPAMASPFTVFLFRQFAITLPDELFQAAKIDGASELDLFFRIALPFIMYQIPNRGPGVGQAMASAMLMSFMPILIFLVAQRQMIRGLTVGALKG